ncbi:MAG TPA: hypothetical protein VKR06_00380 [Ktedonosporobacter sp.]|nr:hypothetical protein [Ktedonosporobacter sp.]
MPVLYHGCPSNIVGDVLYPLNMLKHLYPHTYEREIAKYQDHPDRLKLPLTMIPKLNCLWNDVVQCAPIHPHLLYRALLERGLPIKPGRSFFQIPLSAIQGIPAAIVTSSRQGSDPLHRIPTDAVSLLDPNTYQELTTIPAKTLAWYDHLVTIRKTPGIFKGIPHVMVQGPIPISQARVIRWEEPPI